MVKKVLIGVILIAITLLVIYSFNSAILQSNLVTALLGGLVSGCFTFLGVIYTFKKGGKEFIRQTRIQNTPFFHACFEDCRGESYQVHFFPNGSVNKDSGLVVNTINAHSFVDVHFVNRGSGTAKELEYQIQPARITKRPLLHKDLTRFYNNSDSVESNYTDNLYSVPSNSKLIFSIYHESVQEYTRMIFLRYKDLVDNVYEQKVLIEKKASSEVSLYPTSPSFKV